MNKKENGAMLYFTGVPDSNTGTGVNEYPSIYTEINKNHNIDISILEIQFIWKPSRPNVWNKLGKNLMLINNHYT